VWVINTDFSFSVQRASDGLLIDHGPYHAVTEGEMLRGERPAVPATREGSGALALLSCVAPPCDPAQRLVACLRDDREARGRAAGDS